MIASFTNHLFDARFTRLQRTCMAYYYWMLAQQCLLVAWKAGGPVKKVQAPTCSEVPGLKLSIARRCHSMTLHQIREQLSNHAIGTHIMSDNPALVLIHSATRIRMEDSRNFKLAVKDHNRTFMHSELSELPLALLLGLAESSIIYILGYANLLGCVAIITNHGCVFVIYTRRFVYLHGNVTSCFYRR
jgi:hypothetical protein